MSAFEAFFLGMFAACVIVWGLSYCVINWTRIREAYRRRKQRKLVSRLMAEGDAAKRVKARIRSVGSVYRLPSGRFMIGEGWRFDPDPHAGFSMFYSLDSRGVSRVCGYTYEELTEISARRAEFVDA